jgi:type II secretory ATPase GspE/PulE/Tfp pilus assembly ATPase PilB-like protein
MVREITNNDVPITSQVDHAAYKRIGQILIESNLVTKEQVDKAVSRQVMDNRKKIGSILVELGYITESQYLQAMALKFRRRFVDLSKIIPDKRALTGISRDIAFKFNVFPIEVRGDQIIVATPDPSNHRLLSDLRSQSNRMVDLVVATSGQIAIALKTHYKGNADDQITELIGQMSTAEDEAEQEKEISDTLRESDSRIILLVNKILVDAYIKRASDVHFDSGLPGTPFEIRFRVDSVCSLAYSVPEMSKRAIISRIKVKFALRIKGERIEFRVEVTPTVGNNENVVLRLLNQTNSLSVDQLDLSPYNLDAFIDMITKPQGVVLCVGPTGSGKTTTLHAALGHINKPEITIWTAEDPVEITQHGLKQVQVNPKIGYGFSEALRSFLRADPDVIMIGEMRDVETAKIGLEASLTGHLVFSTLHTNSAAETIVRIIEMGIPFYNFADALLGIIAQRLARKLCHKCKTPYHPNREEYDALMNYYDPKWANEHKVTDYSPGFTLWAKQGCSFCNGIGYYGRIALHEIIVATENVKKAIRRQLDADKLKKVALSDGMRTLRMDGVMKIMQGFTDFEQVKQVCL